MSVFEGPDEICELTPLSKLMLESLVLEGRQGDASFARWLAEVDISTLDWDSIRLVPALWDKFAHVVDAGTQKAGIEEHYRKLLSRNGVFIAAWRRMLVRLLEAGIDLLLFKGLAITLKYHGSVAVRPMADIDVLVRAQSMPRAEQILRQCGWKSVHPDDKKATYLHSYDYIKPDKGGFDLHWHALLESTGAGVDDAVWNRAEFFDWDGLVVKLMAPEDLLLMSVVNGMRDIGVNKFYWIHDVATILAREPGFSWTTLWNEAGNRGLRGTVFAALELVRTVSNSVIPGALLDRLLESDPQFHRDFLATAIAEGRTHHLKRARKAEIEAILRYGGDSQPPGKGSAYAEAADAPHSPRHIRYFLNGDGQVERIFIQRRHLPLLPELFEVEDHAALQESVAAFGKTEDGYLRLGAGLIAPSLSPRLRAYSARIAIADGTRQLVLVPGQLVELRLEVENDSPCCWPVCAGSTACFGATVHLLSNAGQMVAWEMPRAYFLVAKKGYVTFLEPGQMLRCTLKFFAPLEPGRYVAQLDLVQELVEWFSRQGAQFPRIAIEVQVPAPAGRYAVRGPEIVHDTVERETIIINTSSSAYYSTNQSGSALWNAIADGHRVEQIAVAFAADPKSVERFISRLLAEKLIVTADSARTGPSGRPEIAGFSVLELPLLTKHLKLEELLDSDPAHVVSARDARPHGDGSTA